MNRKCNRIKYINKLNYLYLFFKKNKKIDLKINKLLFYLQN